jgi:2,4-dienoyl-CoA reductase (NADPH2)
VFSAPPRHGREIEFDAPAPADPKRIAVVGAGPAGLACAVTAAERGHAVTLYEAQAKIGGQLNLARNVPGKEEFDETLRYYRRSIERLGVALQLGRRPGAEELAAAGFEAIVVATGVIPRVPAVPGIGHAKCVSYVDILSGAHQAGPVVAVIGAGVVLLLLSWPLKYLMHGVK